MKLKFSLFILTATIMISCGGSSDENDAEVSPAELGEELRNPEVDAVDVEIEYSNLLENYELANTYSLTELMEYGESETYDFELFVLGPQGAAVTHYPEGKSIEHLSIEGDKYYIDGDVYNAYYLLKKNLDLEIWDEQGMLASYTFEQK